MHIYPFVEVAMESDVIGLQSTPFNVPWYAWNEHSVPYTCTHMSNGDRFFIPDSNSCACVVSERNDIIIYHLK